MSEDSSPPRRPRPPRRRATETTSPIVTALVGACPHCGQGQIYQGLFGVKDQCEVCGARFNRETGTFVGAIGFSYVFGSIFAFLVLGLWWVTGWIFEDGAEWWIVGIIVPFQLVTLRFVKGFNLGLMAEAGMIYPDPPAARGDS